MDKAQALQVFVNQLPTSGMVDYEGVENSLRNSADGRRALRFFHQLRREGAISTSISNDGKLLVGRASGTVG